jgi:hypothetical protein
VFDGLLLALPGTPFRFLMAPVKAVKQPPYMSAVVTNAELRLDKLGNSLGRP